MPIYVSNVAPETPEERRREVRGNLIWLAAPVLFYLGCIIYAGAAKPPKEDAKAAEKSRPTAEPKWETWRDAKGPVPAAHTPYR
jgi:hypothetical protein